MFLHVIKYTPNIYIRLLCALILQKKKVYTKIKNNIILERCSQVGQTIRS